MTKFLTPLLFSFLFLFSCTENEETVEQFSDDVFEEEISEETIEQYFYVANLDDYSDEFIAEMREMSLPSLELKGDMIIVENDTQYFPQHPTIGEYQVYTALKDTLAVGLSIERLNFTTIEYKLEMVKFGEASYEREGIIELSPIYFFTGESGQEFKDENVYFSNNVANDSCNFSVKFKQNVSTTHVYDGEAILSTDCSEIVLKAIDETNFPVLIRKN